MGMNYGLRRLAELGVKAQQIRATGGGSKSGIWRQIMADIFNAEVVTLKVERGGGLWSGAAGAVVLALAAGREGDDQRDHGRIRAVELGGDGGAHSGPCRGVSGTPAVAGRVVQVAAARVCPASEVCAPLRLPINRLLDRDTRCDVPARASAGGMGRRSTRRGRRSAPSLPGSWPHFMRNRERRPSMNCAVGPCCARPGRRGTGAVPREAEVSYHSPGLRKPPFLIRRPAQGGFAATDHQCLVEAIGRARVQRSSRASRRARGGA